MKKSEFINSIKDLIPFSAGGTYKSLTDMLYDIRLLKYVKQSHIRKIKPSYSKICSHEKLEKLVELGFLSDHDKVFSATNKTVNILREYNYQVDLLPGTIKGNGDQNELNNTEVFIEALKHPDYLALLYPRFPKEKPYIIPDGLLVLKKKININ